MQDQFKRFQSRKNELAVDNSCFPWGNPVIIPFRLRDDDLRDNHPGIVRMKALARSMLEGME